MAGSVFLSVSFEKTLTVFHEKVKPGLFQTVPKDVLVDLHHVGAEDPLVATCSHVGARRSCVSLQHVGAAFLLGEIRTSSESQINTYRSVGWKRGFLS